MADAGRILIMPKGNYNPSVSYEMLDLVFHNDVSWIAKKPVIGVEPSEANADYWFKMVDNSGLQNIINGTTPVGNALKLNGLTAEEFVSNDNLLINSDFRNPVNSSGKTEWTTTGTTVDKWLKSNNNATVTLSDDGLIITFTGTSYFQLAHEIVNWESLLGKTITLSAKANGVVYSKTYTLPSTAESNIDTSELALPRGYFDLYKQTNQPALQLRYIMSTTVGNSITFEWIKLELGKQATPFVPPNKEVEKLKCGKADADTVDGKHASDFALKTKSFMDYLDYGYNYFDGSYDLNNWNKSGAYGVSSSCTNTPDVSSKWATLLVVASSTAKVLQIYKPWNSGGIYYRFGDNGDWGVWVKLANEDKVLPLDGSKPMSGAFLFKGGYGRLNADGNWISLQSWETNDVSLKNGRALQISNSKHTHGSIEKCLQLCDIVGGKETKYFVHHDGNSAKVVVSSTPLTAEGSIRVW